MNSVNAPLFIVGYVLSVVIFICLLLFCDKEQYKSKNSDVVYKGHRYDIVKLNDTTFVVVAGLDGDKNFRPVVIKSKDVSKFSE